MSPANSGTTVVPGGESLASLARDLEEVNVTRRTTSSDMTEARHDGPVDDGDREAAEAAQIMRTLAEQVRDGVLVGKSALPYLLGAAAALEARAAATAAGPVSEGPPAST